MSSKIVDLIESGFCLIPLKPDSKIPAVPWKYYFETAHCEVDDLVGNFLYAQQTFGDIGVGMVLGPASKLICLDCDAPPYPKQGKWVSTPRGGRHYFYVYRSGDRFGINVSPGHDIPRMVRLYDPDFHINPGRIPEQAPEVRAKPPSRRAATSPIEPVPMEHLDKCEFVKWFKSRRDDDSWDGRYPLARAYASQVARSDGNRADGRLGNDYQHEEGIYNRLPAPISCAFIYANGYPCQQFHEWSDTCMLQPGAEFPLTMARQAWNSSIKRNLESGPSTPGETLQPFKSSDQATKGPWPPSAENEHPGSDSA